MNKFAEHSPFFLQDWKENCRTSDECSSGPLKYLAKFFLGKHRNYACICLQHDFDYQYGWRYGISKRQADSDLRDGIIAAGEPGIARLVYLGVLTFGWLHYDDGK
jgi:hypothetical protein